MVKSRRKTRKPKTPTTRRTKRHSKKRAMEAVMQRPFRLRALPGGNQNGIRLKRQKKNEVPVGMTMVVIVLAAAVLSLNMAMIFPDVQSSGNSAGKFLQSIQGNNIIAGQQFVGPSQGPGMSPPSWDTDGGHTPAIKGTCYFNFGQNQKIDYCLYGNLVEHQALAGTCTQNFVPCGCQFGACA